MTLDSVEHGIDPEDISTNPSGNTAFQAVVRARWSRRSVIRTGGVVAAAGFFTAATAGPAVAAGHGDRGAGGHGDGGHGGGGHGGGGHGGGGGGERGLLGFKGVSTSKDDKVVVPEGYVAEVLIPWGTPLNSRGPEWKKDASNTAAEQEQQIGMHHDGMHFFPTGRDEGLLVLNHEYVDTTLLYPDGDAVITKEKVAKALAAHGVSVVQVKKDRGGWKNVDSKYNRRVTGTTPVTFSGPVSPKHPALQAGNRPMGTLNNCANGYTPWGTYLACEENWNGYFGTADTSWQPGPEHSRYGVVAAGGGYDWHTADPRFDLSANPNEIHRFGWVVEIDPFRPGSTPVKRTALGRIKHEGATVTESRGRVVVYTGDDQDGEYLYKFVGSAPWKQLRAIGKDPLDHGTLYVAKFNDDGSGTWLPLTFGKGPFTKANGWQDQADIMLRTRTAADALGATKLDRPEWVAVHPHNNDVYLTLTNGSGWESDANPRTPNPYGHIIRWTEKNRDNTATSFEWDIFVLAGDPKYDSQVELEESDIFGSPDGLWFDNDGRLWIQTDVSNSTQNRADRQHDRIGNNQMLVADPRTGEIRRFLVGPKGCEVTGISGTPDGRTLFVNIQHPGESTTFWGTPTPENPRAVSNWPDFDPDGRPRPATLVIRKKDGGVIGT